MIIRANSFLDLRSYRRAGGNEHQRRDLNRRRDRQIRVADHFQTLHRFVGNRRRPVDLNPSKLELRQPSGLGQPTKPEREALCCSVVNCGLSPQPIVCEHFVDDECRPTLRAHR